MKIKRIIIVTILGFATLKAVTLLYGTTENPIVDIGTSQQLDSFLKANPLAVIEFHDLNCPVCQAFQRKRIFQETATALPHIKLAKVSVQEGLNLHKEYKIHNYPTFIFFKDAKQINFNRDGKIVDRFLGYVDNPNFTQKVSAIFAEAELKK